jgi:hypothetical protein
MAVSSLRWSVWVLLLAPVGGGACAPPELCGEGLDPVIEPLAPAAENGLMRAAHAHNDYEHPRPLSDALAAGFASVEVDVWFRDADIQVSHDAFFTKGTLQELYLAPLAAHLTDKASVHDDGAPFFLWLDLKDSTEELRLALVAALANRPFLTQFDDDGVVVPGAVTVVLTGDADSKERLVQETPAPRPFARDDNHLAIDDEEDPRVVAVALNFGNYVGGWNGAGAPPGGMSRQCGCIVQKAKSIGRQVRLFGGPDTQESWAFQLAHGVDFINTDDLSGLAGFLRSR